MSYTVQQHKLMQHLGLRPWIRREIGQEAQAQILRAAGVAAPITGGIQTKPSPRVDAEQRKQQLRQSLGQSSAPKQSPVREAATPALKTVAHHGQQSSERLASSNATLKDTVKAAAPAAPKRQSPLRKAVAPKAEVPTVRASADVGIETRGAQPVSSGNTPSPLSLMYAQVLPGVWLVAECDEWDRGGQALFHRLLKACADLVVRQGYQQAVSTEIEWFHWPLRLPAPIKNDEHNLRQALRGWVNGRRRPGALWISLGRRFVEMLLPSALGKGVRHQGRSGMDVVWFEGLPAMQIESEHKAMLWQFLQQALPPAITALKNSPTS